jgi:hypothetical protein
MFRYGTIAAADCNGTDILFGNFSVETALLGKARFLQSPAEWAIPVYN